MVRPLTLVLILALLMVLSVAPADAKPQRGGAPSGSPVTTTTVTSTVRLVLQLPAAAYPRNALVPATVRLTNLSPQTIQTWDCLDDSLGAKVTGDGKAAPYPPLLVPPGAPWATCPGELGMGSMMRRPTIIAPHATLVRQTYVVLRAFTVRAWADLALTVGQGKPIVIQTPPIHILETLADGPTVHLQPQRPNVAVVIPITGAGRILYSEYASCMTASEGTRVFNASATFSRWIPTSGPATAIIAAPCVRLAEWVLYVAQPGLPIARAYYCRRHDRCVYAPPTPHDQALAACKNNIGRAVTSGRLPRSAARYAIGLISELPSGLTPAQEALARSFHARCAPLLKSQSP